MAIEKGKIELQPGSIAPVERGLWHAAWEKLHEAAVGLKDMEAAKDRIQYEDGWTKLVDSLQEFWTRFYDEGKNTFTAFQPWAGAIDVKRKSDPLLAYLKEARDKSQHGRIKLEWESGTISVGGDEYFGTVRNLKIFTNGSFQADVNATAGSNAKFKIIHNPGKARLPSIVRRKDSKVFQPPSTHLECAITDPSPINVGRLGIAFCDDILRQGFEKFRKAP